LFSAFVSPLGQDFPNLHKTLLLSLAAGHKLAGFQQLKEYSPPQEPEILFRHHDYPEPLTRRRLHGSGKQHSSSWACMPVAGLNVLIHSCGTLSPIK